MDSLSKLVDSTPILGPIKGVCHYARGEKEKGDEAMYQSTRTSAVIAGGIFGGPAGAMGAGLATDAAASALTKKERGLINSCKNIAEDIEAKRNPTRSIASAGLQLGLDGISGYGGSSSGMSNASRRAVAKTMQKGEEVIIQKSVRISAAEAARILSRKTAERAAQRAFLISSHVALTAAQKIQLEERERREKEKEERERWRGRERSEREWREREQREREQREREQREREQREREQREREQREREQRERQQQRRREQQKFKKQEECKKGEQRANSEKQKRNTSGSSSGSSQPPQGNKDNNRKCKGKQEPDFFEIFMTLLRRVLKIVYGNESEPFSAVFKNLSKGDREYLVKVLKPLAAFGTLDEVIELVIRLFEQYFPDDISFGVFLSLLEFVQSYIADELLERTRISSGTETAETKMKPNERRETIISEIVSERDIIDKLRSRFVRLKTEIDAETANPIFPNFRDIFAAVYHYIKHKRLPVDGKILSVKEYYVWIRKFLKELKTTEKYAELKAAKISVYVYKPLVPEFCRRFKIVLKRRDNKIVLSSAFVIDMMDPDDKKHVVTIVAEIFALVFMAIGLFYILKGVFFCTTIILLNAASIISTCITYPVQLLLNTLLFFFAPFNFILKVLFIIFQPVFSCATIILLNVASIISPCITYPVQLLLNTLLFFFAPFIFILKVLFIIFEPVFSCATIILLNAASIISACITYPVELLLNTLLFFFAPFIYILKVLFIILKGVFSCATTILLNAALIISTCITFPVQLLLTTSLFVFACFIFILKVLLIILLVSMFLRFVFFFFPDPR